MSLRIIVHSAARSDVIDIASYIADDNLAAADRFIEAVDAAFKRLAGLPGIGVTREYRHPALKGMRMWPVPGFPNYLIFYRATATDIRITRVLQSARDIASIFHQDEEDPDDQ